MDSKEEARYRLRLAEGYLQEAEQLLGVSQWRACVSSAQLAVENSPKAVLALVGPLPKSHDLSAMLLDAAGDLGLGEESLPVLQRLAECARLLGFREHIMTDYGDELAYRTPWEIYEEGRARRAFAVAQEAYRIGAGLLVSGPFRSDENPGVEHS
jgi:HEPN domain-containing protein